MLTQHTPYHFYKLSPGGNTTILITSPQVTTASSRSSFARHLLSELHLGGEQVGYLNLASRPPRLDMMGGEFCGNASRSFAAVLLLENSPHLVKTAEDSWQTTLSVSGVNRPLQAKVSLKNGEINSWVEMPIRPDPSNIRPVQWKNHTIHIIHLDGITHILLGPDFPFPQKSYEQTAAELRSSFSLTEEEAVGCIWFSPHQDAFRITPVVWVKDTATTYYETACGSGTVALGLLQSFLHKGDFSAEIIQPSNHPIATTVSYQEDTGVFREAWIGGIVTPIASGKTYL